MDSRDAMLESLYSIFASITGVLLGTSVLCMVQIGYIMFCCCTVCCTYVCVFTVDLVVLRFQSRLCECGMVCGFVSCH